RERYVYIGDYRIRWPCRKHFHYFCVFCSVCACVCVCVLSVCVCVCFECVCVCVWCVSALKCTNLLGFSLEVIRPVKAHTYSPMLTHTHTRTHTHSQQAALLRA